MNAIQQDRGRAIAAISLIGLGGLFLLDQLFNISIFSILWPFFVIVPGAAFLYFALTGGKNTVGLSVPGSVVTGTGLILLYQSLTGHWESWAYAWTLYPVFVGLALTFMGNRTGDQNVHNTGRGLVRWGGVAFIVAAALFELLIFNGGGFLGSLALPILLVGLGAWMLFGKGIRGSGIRNFGKPKNDEFVFNGPRVVTTRPRYGSSSVINEDLQRKIDAALAEDDEPEVKPKDTTVV
jgi:hypothetical protein